MNGYEVNVNDWNSATHESYVFQDSEEREQLKVIESMLSKVLSTINAERKQIKTYKLKLEISNT